MNWNYRVVKYKNGDGYGLHEVYYDEAGLPWGMTEDAARFHGESKDGTIKALVVALRDARKSPVLAEPEKWPGRSP